MNFPRFLPVLACMFSALAFVNSVGAHELWIEPQEYQVEKGANLRADFKNGEEFSGVKLAYFDYRSTRFDQMFGGQVTPVTARTGDLPAYDATAPEADGLLVLAHEAAASNLRYRNWEKFLKFARHKDFPTAAQTHVANGWSQDDFRETYTRHVKALIAVGDGRGADQPLGLATEFVALTNPYATGFASPMQVQLLYQNAPRADAQVEVFARAPDDTVTITLHRTGADGIANIPVQPGYDYLFDAVVLRPAAGQAADPAAPVWETLWAALSFHVPD